MSSRLPSPPPRCLKNSKTEFGLRLGVMAQTNSSDIPDIDVEGGCTFDSEDGPVPREETEDGTMRTPSNVPEELHLEYGTENVQKAEKFLRLASYQLHDLITDKRTMRDLFQTLQDDVGLSKHQPVGAYECRMLFYPKVLESQICLLLVR